MSLPTLLRADGRVGPAEGAFTNCTSMLACFALGGGALLRQLKLVRTPSPGSRSIHSLEVGLYNNQWVVSKGKRPG